jgi:lipid II:glycine glycyltransferase (peptidoglycan interpeptide bridge formation enzyme)
LLDDFYRVYTIRMKQLGTPPYCRKLIQYILEAFPDNSRLFVVRLDDLTIGAALTTHFNNFVEIPLASTLTQYNNLCPNNLLYWAVIKHYCLAGAKCFDFGRCTAGGPTYQFKKQWGPEPVELHYQYWLRPGHKLSILSPENPKYKRRVEMWKKLPLWVTRLLGPYISRNLP